MKGKTLQVCYGSACCREMPYHYRSPNIQLLAAQHADQTRPTPLFQRQVVYPATTTLLAL
eukprot:3134368-Pleurochrysis_carterae.AAC.1